MLKNKEDDFLGDNITNNIKYAENEWQGQGTVDRNSVYTKESLLHLLFEGFNYDRDIGDYKDYVARASTSLITATEAEPTPYVAAKLQHDLYILDALYYTSTSTSCAKNIFDTTTYLKKAIAVANPTFDDKAVVKKIPLIDPTIFENDTTTKTYDIFKYLLTNFYSGKALPDTVAKLNAEDFKCLENILDRYDKNYTVETLKDDAISQIFISLFQTYFQKNTDLITDSMKAYVGYYANTTSRYFAYMLATPFRDFMKVLDSEKIIVDNKACTVLDIFLDDFSLHVHDPNTIKLPFNKRGEDAQSIAENDKRTYLTRFLANSVSKSIHINENIAIDLGYFEYTNDLLEEALFANFERDENDVAEFEFYENRDDVNSKLTTSTNLAKEVIGLKASVYKDFYDVEETATATLIESQAKIIDNVDSLIALYCPDVFTGYSSSNKPETSWGIHYLNEENTENLFQDKDSTYRLYNNVLLGYKLADALVALRTFVGGILFLEHKITTLESLIYTIPRDVPLNKRTVNSFFSDFEDFKDSKNNFYPAISMINVIYAVGHGKSAEDYFIEKNAETSYRYNFNPEIKDWLNQECIVFKGPMYGDYVEELNFMQDLTPDSDVQFSNLRIKKTEIPYRRYQDSKYEVPYLEQTRPLLNNTPENKKGLGVYGSDAFAAKGNIVGNDSEKSLNTIPAFIYDYDKGDQEKDIATVVDPRILNNSGDKQYVKSSRGRFVSEDRIESPTIDELWTFLKYLTESDGSGVDSDVNERLPQFYGIKRSSITKDTIEVASDTNTENRLTTNRLNPLHLIDGVNVDSEPVIDILRWKPISKQETRLHWNSKHRPELQFGGYKITRYIEKIYDYKVLPFSRRESLLDTDEYEFNTEVSSDFNNVTGYLEKLYNSAILNFDLVQVEPGVEITTDNVRHSIKAAHPLEDSKDDLGIDQKLFTASNDKNLNLNNKPVHSTIEREKAFKDITRILVYHKPDGENDIVDGKEISYHNHYKRYLKNPKNLKEIERDLETIRQNLQTLAEYMVASYANLGYADRAANRGTLHQLHKNAYDWLSTWLYNVNATKATTNDLEYRTNVELDALTDDLNDLIETLEIVDADKKVIYEDGVYDDRYLIENYDHFILDLNSNTRKHIRNKHPIYRPNETLLSEVYLAADGTWRSIHEHTVLPVLFSDH